MGRWIRITELVKDYAYSVWVIEGSKIVEDYLWHGKRDEVKKKVEEKFNVKCQEWREDWIWNERRQRYVKIVDMICD